MSNLAHPATLVRSPFAVRRTAILLGLLALVVAALVVVAVTLPASDTDATRPAVSAQPAARSDGGPAESAVASSVGARPSAGPSESAIAAAVGVQAPPATAIPDESRIAASISGR